MLVEETNLNIKLPLEIKLKWDNVRAQEQVKHQKKLSIKELFEMMLNEYIDKHNIS